MYLDVKLPYKTGFHSVALKIVLLEADVKVDNGNKYAGLIVIWYSTIGGRHVKFRMGTCHKHIYL
jgi:hypothetical protein